MKNSRAVLPMCLVVQALLFCAMSLFGVSPTETKISDDLGLASRAEGTALNGSSVGAGNIEWSASSNLTFASTASGDGVTCENVNPFFAHVPIQDDVKTVEISVDIRPAISEAAPDGWAALGMGPETYENKLLWGEGVLLLVQPSGDFQLVANPEANTTHVIRIKGTVPDFSQNEMVSLGLRFDAGENTITAKINGVVVVDSYSLSEKGFHPKIRLAGFSGFGQLKNKFIANNFNLKITN
jgi:hypothetical protein